MLRRTAQISVGLALAFCPALVCGQAAQPQYFIFCAAQAPPAAAGAPATVYYSGIMQGTAANMQNFRTDFTTFLAQKYAYKGAAACAPRTTSADAQTMMTNQETAFRNAKRNVIETGWTEGGAGGILGGGGSNPLGAISNPLGSILGGGQPNTAAPTNQTKAAATGTQTAQTTAGAGQQGQATGRGGAGGGGNAGGNQSAFNNVFGQIFGNGGGGGGNGGGQGQAGQANGGGRGGAGGGPPATGATGTGGTGTQSGGGGRGGNTPFEQVTGALGNVFGNKGGNGGGGNGGGRGGQPGGGQPGQPGAGNTIAENNAPKQPGSPAVPGAKPGQPNQPEGILGSAQFGTTKLDIYGCGRQDLQVACIAQLTNQNPKDTLVKSADIWKDAFIVDDRGDRHTRTSAFFLNIDGEQRPQLDISNGKSAKFVLMFDQVPTKVQKVTLRSQTGGLDVEDMGLLAADGSAPGTTTASAPAAQH